MVHKSIRKGQRKDTIKEQIIDRIYKEGYYARI